MIWMVFIFLGTNIESLFSRIIASKSLWSKINLPWDFFDSCSRWFIAVNSAPSTMRPSEPDADSSTNPIQYPVSSNKNSWCLVGEYANKANPNIDQSKNEITFDDDF